jgi:hypothetical protein
MQRSRGERGQGRFLLYVYTDIQQMKKVYGNNDFSPLLPCSPAPLLSAVAITNS